jgi:hypothetical protein
MTAPGKYCLGAPARMPAAASITPVAECDCLWELRPPREGNDEGLAKNVAER